MTWAEVRSAIVACGVVFLAVLALDAYPGLRGGSGWDWTYMPPESAVPVIILAVCVALYTAGALIWRRMGAVRAGLVWTVAGGVVLAYAVVGVSAQGDTPFHLLTRTFSPVQTGASALAVRLAESGTTSAALRDWTGVMREALSLNLIHFTTTPPGQVIAHQALADVFDSPALVGISEPLSVAWRVFQCGDVDVMRYTRGEMVSAGVIAWLMPLFAALTALPLYSVAHQLTGERDTALGVAQWWALIPAVLLFAPVWNTFYPLPVTLSFALLVYGLRARRDLPVFGAGLVMSLTTFLNFSVLPVFLLFGLFTLGYWFAVARHESPAMPFVWTVRAGAVFGAGLAVVWGVFALWGGQTPFELFAVTLEKHRTLVQRDYFAWVILHPYDVLLFTGWGASALALWGAGLSVRRLREGALSALDVLVFSMGLTFVAVNVAGIVQGENARILIFYMPFLLLMGARLIGRGWRWSAPVLGVQALAVVVMGSVLAVVPLDLNPQLTAPRGDIGTLGDEVSLPFIESGVEFSGEVYGGAFTLARYRYVGDPSAQAITYEFEWGGITPSERPYAFELRATAENSIDGEIIAEPFRWVAQGGNYPPTCWRAGDTVRDVVVLPLPAIAEPVVWSVSLQAIDPRTGDALPALVLSDVRYP